ncbi:DUF4166 domain-containing protein [Cohnella sp. CFH 77786]|uniref:DUF4166 domain-containing protein n=1 Tax=Cohnella sp. CFH 77786 TaxID=2662265 RepID=UPI001C60D7F5|nr:DUF4166 domain-containing protein [Cohnella sp. CFH 77786]MBW5447622.1 DUF4166 domain-containing protein [Cohnella sp. CFH 77786]
MASIYERVLGEDFAKLHPQIRKRFGFGSADQMASIGRGVMEQVWYGKWFTLPFLALGTWRNILFPQRGQEVPFTIENYAYQDSFGRETVTWIRTYHFPDRVRRFDATMIYSENKRKIIDYLGTHQHLAVEIDMSVAENGGMRLRSGEQFFYEGRVGFRFPMIFSGYADVCEWYDEETEKFRIDVQVNNKFFGPLFGYRGSFEVEYISMDGREIPQHVKPLREERRE